MLSILIIIAIAFAGYHRVAWLKIGLALLGVAVVIVPLQLGTVNAWRAGTVDRRSAIVGAHIF